HPIEHDPAVADHGADELVAPLAELRQQGLESLAVDVPHRDASVPSGAILQGAARRAGGRSAWPDGVEGPGSRGAGWRTLRDPGALVGPTPGGAGPTSCHLRPAPRWEPIPRSETTTGAGAGLSEGRRRSPAAGHRRRAGS